MRDSWLHTSDQFKAMMIGKLLGDGSITKQNGRRPRFQFTNVNTDIDWSRYCYDQLSKTIPLNPPMFKKTIDPRLIKGYSLSYYVQSKTSNIICYLRKKWYVNRKKVIPFDLLKTYFNKQTLAWWYMDDGHLKIKDNIPQKIILSTESFTTKENKSLIHLLDQTYDLKFRLDKQNRIILYNQFQIKYFLYLVQPYLHPSMYRKIIPYQNIIHALPSRRTTIYLPVSININSPTKDINTALQYLPILLNTFKTGLLYDEFKENLFNKINTAQNSYQIIINDTHLSNLQLLKELTGLSFSRLTELCFMLKYESCRL